MGIEKTVSELAEILGVSRQAVNNRIKSLPEEDLEKSIKKYLDNLFQYSYKELNLVFKSSNDEFSNISGNYTSYEKVPKVNYDILNFLLDITSKFIEEDEKNIIKELTK
jgi:DNA-binding Lrp family transcriptional regulator